VLLDIKKRAPAVSTPPATAMTDDARVRLRGFGG